MTVGFKVSILSKYLAKIGFSCKLGFGFIFVFVTIGFKMSKASTFAVTVTLVSISYFPEHMHTPPTSKEVSRSL